MELQNLSQIFVIFAIQRPLYPHERSNIPTPLRVEHAHINPALENSKHHYITLLEL